MQTPHTTPPPASVPLDDFLSESIARAHRAALACSLLQAVGPRTSHAAADVLTLGTPSDWAELDAALEDWWSRKSSGGQTAA